MLRLGALLFALVFPLAASGGTLRVAAYDAELARRGAGQLLHDLGKEPDAHLEAVVAAIVAARADVLLVSGFDHDLRGRALDAFRGLLRRRGLDYPHSFAAPVNAGEVSHLDLDGDTLLTGWGDAHGWGRFPGNGGMAVLSRLPLDAGAVRSFRTLRWADLPGAELPRDADGRPWPDAEAAAARRLSSRSHWDVPVALPDGGRLHLLAAGPTPPLYDGEERSNKLRNRDELLLWATYLDGVPLTDDAGRTAAAPEEPVVVLGDFLVDPADGAGLRDGISALLGHRRLQDPRPASAGAEAAGADDRNLRHRGDPALDTADMKDEDGPGNLRLDYVLPDARLTVTGAGVLWPPDGDLARRLAEGPAHRLVWVDIDLP